MENKGKHYIQDCIIIAGKKGFRYESNQAKRQLDRLVYKSDELVKTYTEEEVKDLIDFITNNAEINNGDLYINYQLLDPEQTINRWVERNERINK